MSLISAVPSSPIGSVIQLMFDLSASYFPGVPISEGKRGVLFVVSIPNINIYILSNCAFCEDIKQVLIERKDQATGSLWVVA